MSPLSAVPVIELNVGTFAAVLARTLGNQPPPPAFIGTALISADFDEPPKPGEVEVAGELTDQAAHYFHDSPPSARLLAMSFETFAAAADIERVTAAYPRDADPDAYPVWVAAADQCAAAMRADPRVYAFGCIALLTPCPCNPEEPAQ